MNIIALIYLCVKYRKYITTVSLSQKLLSEYFVMPFGNRKIYSWEKKIKLSFQMDLFIHKRDRIPKGINNLSLVYLNLIPMFVLSLFNPIKN